MRCLNVMESGGNCHAVRGIISACSPKWQIE